MANISDIIEEFIISQFEEMNNNEINISRNELANFFNCAPSQINYVLSTRFNFNTGFDVESRRGGGGYVKVIKLNNSKNAFLTNIIKSIQNEDLTNLESLQIIDALIKKKVISNDIADIIKIATSDKSLSVGVNIQNRLRSKILVNILKGILKED